MLGELELAIVDFCANLTCWPFAGRTHFQNFCRLAPSFVGSVGINPEGDPSKPIAAAFSQVRRCLFIQLGQLLHPNASIAGCSGAVGRSNRVGRDSCYIFYAKYWADREGKAKRLCEV